MIDTSIIRVHQHAACIVRNKRQSMGRSRGGLTSKIHALVDTNGLPVRLALTAGEAHDNRLAGKLLSRLKSRTMLLADRGYDADWIRALADERGVWANIPPRCNRNDPACFSPHLYKARNLVERFFNKIKQCRRVATRLRQTRSQLPRLHPARINPARCALMSPRPSRCGYKALPGWGVALKLDAAVVALHPTASETRCGCED
jgi:transposase